MRILFEKWKWKKLQLIIIFKWNKKYGSAESSDAECTNSFTTKWLTLSVFENSLPEHVKGHSSFTETKFDHGSKGSTGVAHNSFACSSLCPMNKEVLMV